MTSAKPDSLSDGEGGKWEIGARQDTWSGMSGFYPVGPLSVGPPVAYVFGREEAAKISAAPDLLEALKLVTQSTEWPTMERDTQDAVLAAIAKAEAAS